MNCIHLLILIPVFNIFFQTNGTDVSNGTVKAEQLVNGASDGTIKSDTAKKEE